MHQIYYTQCPLGYGRGVGNGFQIKRISAGYPETADFRHLNMRPLLPGSRTLAPRALRYRRDQGIAEIAWLVPRPLEYVTERGAWGRPGGLFAHGLRLPVEDLASLRHWPAGLYGSTLWCEEDREPTRPPAHEPPPRELGANALARPAEVATLLELATSFQATDEFLAALLTASARVVSEARTLFLIADPDQLVAMIQWITLAFPGPLRPDLTFSTYHDRPEELNGFRIQGTIPQVRPNRQALRALGFVAEASTGVIDPPIEADAWARTLVGWIRQGRLAELIEWQDWGERAAPSTPAADRFSTKWLDTLTRFQNAIQPAAPPPANPDDWKTLQELTQWAHASGLDRSWLERFPARWWIQVVPDDLDRSAILAFVSQESVIRRSADLADPTDWGHATALWLRRQSTESRHKNILRFLRAWSGFGKTAFASSLLAKLNVDRASQTLERLRHEPEFDPALLLPLEAWEAVVALSSAGNHWPIAATFQRGLEQPEHLASVLDVIDKALAGKNQSIRTAAFETLAASLNQALDPGLAEVLRWALVKGKTGERWLRPYFLATFGDPGREADLRRIHRLTPQNCRLALAQIAMPLAFESGMPDNSLRWAVEKILLRLDDHERATIDNPRWSNEFLFRISFLELVQLRHSRSGRNPDLIRWIDAARNRGELTAESLARLEHCDQYARSLKAQDASWLLTNNLPEVPPDDRRGLLEQLLRNLGSASLEQLDLCLDSCRRSWPGAFSSGADGLDGLAEPLARTLLAYRGDPHRWFDQLKHMLGRLLSEPEVEEYAPRSLAAFITAATIRMTEPTHPDYRGWALRKYLIQQDDAWRILAEDARQDLDGENPTPEAEKERNPIERASSARVFRVWNNQLENLVTFTRPTVGTRFYELMLNAGTPTSLFAIALDQLADLASQPSLRDLPWWAGTGPDDDIREGFARHAPITPLPADSLPMLRNWLGMPRPFQPAPPEATAEAPSASPDEIALVPEDEPLIQETGSILEPRLSPGTRARWYCIHALSVFARPGQDERDRWRHVLDLVKNRTAPIDQLTGDEPYQWVAWLIERTRDYDAVHVEIARFANELVRQGVRDAGRISAWPRDLNGLVPDIRAVDTMRPGLRQFLSELGHELKERLREWKETTTSKRRT